MARIEARGNLRRSLKKVGLEALPSSEERDIRASDKVVGRLGKVVEHPSLGVIGLAVVRNDLSPHALLRVGNVGLNLKG
jgi:folate-binding Fe-S cluster repair protein YgfZ